jgi:hypothetical protein
MVTGTDFFQPDATVFDGVDSLTLCGEILEKSEYSFCVYAFSKHSLHESHGTRGGRILWDLFQKCLKVNRVSWPHSFQGCIAFLGEYLGGYVTDLFLDGCSLGILQCESPETYGNHEMFIID